MLDTTGFLQRDVAEYAEVGQSTFSSNVETGPDYYPIEEIEKIAELFRIPTTALLDEYNTVLYHGQGQQLQMLRRSKNMTAFEFFASLEFPLEP